MVLLRISMRSIIFRHVHAAAKNDLDSFAPLARKAALPSKNRPEALLPGGFFFGGWGLAGKGFPLPAAACPTRRMPCHTSS